MSKRAALAVAAFYSAFVLVYGLFFMQLRLTLALTAFTFVGSYAGLVALGVKPRRR
jgi:hypothetical protein